MKLEEFAKTDFSSEDSALWNIRKALDSYRLKIRNPNADLPGRFIDEACRRCGERQVYCGHAELATVDYLDTFWHLCMNCLDARYEENSFSCCSSEADEEIHCPYCSRDC